MQANIRHKQAEHSQEERFGQNEETACAKTSPGIWDDTSQCKKSRMNGLVWTPWKERSLGLVKDNSHKVTTRKRVESDLPIYIKKTQTGDSLFVD